MRCEIIDGKAESAAHLLGALLRVQWLKPFELKPYTFRIIQGNEFRYIFSHEYPSSSWSLLGLTYFQGFGATET